MRVCTFIYRDFLPNETPSIWQNQMEARFRTFRCNRRNIWIIRKSVSENKGKWVPKPFVKNVHYFTYEHKSPAVPSDHCPAFGHTMVNQMLLGSHGSRAWRKQADSFPQHFFDLSRITLLSGIGIYGNKAMRRDLYLLRTKMLSFSK